MTALDHLVEALRGRDVVLDGQVRPAAVLWTDPEGQWRPLVDVLLARMEELVVLGEYNPERRTGPAIWIRCVVDRTLEAPMLSGDRAPVVYLPGVGRQELRAGEECPEALRPLVELMFRGALWIQPNGSDWTVTAFLGSPRTLELDIARDRATQEALVRALPEVMLSSLAQLRGRRLEADDFDRMLADDVVRDLLLWMGDPEGTRNRLGGSRWGAFCSRCREELDFDPERDADVIAGERMAQGEGSWAKVWQRFEEAPTAYPGVPDLLRRSGAGQADLFERERWPDLNDSAEGAVRKELEALSGRPHAEVCEAVLRLENEHGQRRGWVWTRLGLSAMAEVLEPLSRLAEAVSRSLGGPTPDDMAAEYQKRGWQADAASWEALALAEPRDEALVGDIVRVLLEPWLDQAARAFQAALGRGPIPSAETAPVVEAEHGECLLFADGLRFDVAVRLAQRLEDRGARVTFGHRWAALPTVTATAKPAVTPLADELAGETLGGDLAPMFRASRKPAVVRELRAALERRGYQILENAALGVPHSDRARGWLESGEIDSLGHKLGARLAGQLGQEIERLTEEALRLLDAGWDSVRIVTDHGWLFLPGGLPKVDLPRHLTETRWARCAVLAGESVTEAQRYPWFWNGEQHFATPPGIACFNRQQEYAHGGVSLQECLVPDLVVERSDAERVQAAISAITWRGFRCFVEASAKGAAVMADLRVETPRSQEEADSPSVVAKPRPVGEDGTVSLVLKDDEYESVPLVLVLLDENGNVLARRKTRVGEDS